VETKTEARATRERTAKGAICLIVNLRMCSLNLLIKIIMFVIIIEIRKIFENTSKKLRYL
jgi:hypothetical protein